MRKSRFTEEQMVTVLREADSTSVAEAAKKHKVSDATIYAWRKHFGQCHYNAVRPHSSLDYLTPHEFKQRHHPLPNPAVLQE